MSRLAWQTSTGTVLGAPSTSPWRPPPPLPPVPIEALQPRARTGCALDQTEEVVKEMVRTFCELGNGRNAGMLMRLKNSSWYAPLRLAAREMRYANASPSGYVRFVVERVIALRGRFPYPMEVFSQKALAGWIPVFLRGRSKAPGTTYRAAPGRRREYMRRFVRLKG